MARVTSKGQITLPKEVRDALGLVPGTGVQFEVEPGRVVLRKRVDPEPVDPERIHRWVGYLRDKRPGESVDDFINQLRGEPLTDECASQ